MAQYRDIELSDGTQVRVYVPPTQRIIAMVEKAIPRPPKPMPPVITEKNVVGAEISMSIDHDPAYQAALYRWENQDIPEWRARTNEEIDKRSALFIFKDVQVPDDWDVEAEIGELIRLDEPDWEPTPGPLGRKRDYIQWALLGDPVDALLVQQTLAEMASIDLSEVNANEATF